MNLRTLAIPAMLVASVAALAPAQAQTICVLDCTVEVTLPPEPGVGVNTLAGSEHVYLHGCTDTFEEEVFCVRAVGVLGAAGAHLACPDTEPACFEAAGGQVLGVNVFLGLIVVYDAAQPCVLSGAAALGNWLYQKTVCAVIDSDAPCVTLLVDGRPTEVVCQTAPAALP